MANWTPEEIEKLRQLSERGASRLLIAAKMRRKMSVIVAVAKAHGIRLKTAGEIRKANGLGASWTLNRDY